MLQLCQSARGFGALIIKLDSITIHLFATWFKNMTNFSTSFLAFLCLDSHPEKKLKTLKYLL